MAIAGKDRSKAFRKRKAEGYHLVSVWIPHSEASNAKAALSAFRQTETWPEFIVRNYNAIKGTCDVR